MSSKNVTAKELSEIRSVIDDYFSKQPGCHLHSLLNSPDHEPAANSNSPTKLRNLMVEELTQKLYSKLHLRNSIHNVEEETLFDEWAKTFDYDIEHYDTPRGTPRKVHQSIDDAPKWTNSSIYHTTPRKVTRKFHRQYVSSDNLPEPGPTEPSNYPTYEYRFNISSPRIVQEGVFFPSCIGKDSDQTSRSYRMDAFDDEICDVKNLRKCVQSKLFLRKIVNRLKQIPNKLSKKF